MFFSDRVAIAGSVLGLRCRASQYDVAGALRQHLDARLGPLADAALGHVEDPPQ